jgi:hypothetical protein
MKNLTLSPHEAQIAAALARALVREITEERNGAVLGAGSTVHDAAQDPMPPYVSPSSQEYPPVGCAADAGERINE